MTRAIKAARTRNAGQGKKAIATPVKRPKAVPGKAPSTKGNTPENIGRESLEAMFKAAISRNESLEVRESDDYGAVVRQFNEIIKLLDAILALDPAYRDVINYKGMMLYGCGDIPGAIECFDSILKLNPADKEALNNKGISLYGLGRDEDALKCVDAAIAVDGRYADACMNKAIILHSLGRDEEADKFFRKARAFDAITG